ncbi:MAG: hypothetical protein CVV14_04300 [Gammaproteobacteria bacterium HGW-Gammaproteobacteria-4]|jgi:hypothetical protein|nr:MAG: hypothetical protein CVV14_04300 [Gammaproteobacteria bacterium HGW-Gammaproteobacteria-4]
MNDLVAWIEAHQATVDLLKAAVLLLVAWVSGLFAYLRRFRKNPKLEVADTASFVYLEQMDEFDGQKNVVRAAFIINASVINASNEKVVVDHFLLSFRTFNVWRSHRQKLVRIGFPSRPRKRLGISTKQMGVWFTQYPEDEVQMEHATGALEPKELCGGYLLFTSFTWGGWNPKQRNGMVHITLKVKLTSQKWLSKSVWLRATTDATKIEEMSPGMVEHLKHETTWHHDLTIWGK